ncbi:hypothetical protein CEK25_005584 [Fusarium fujikuroi]|nr:hypothetical protein CEK25_005584 [Fusarium fujikuroi]
MPDEPSDREPQNTATLPVLHFDSPFGGYFNAGRHSDLQRTTQNLVLMHFRAIRHNHLHRPLGLGAVYMIDSCAMGHDLALFLIGLAKKRKAYNFIVEASGL